jgi:transposase
MTRRERRTFSKEFKIEAVRQSNEHGVSVIAERLGVGPDAISRWRRQFEEAGPEAFRGNGNRTALEEENRQLRLENRRLKEEAEILKKASAYFAKHIR